MFRQQFISMKYNRQSPADVNNYSARIQEQQQQQVWRQFSGGTGGSVFHMKECVYQGAIAKAATITTNCARQVWMHHSNYVPIMRFRLRSVKIQNSAMPKNETSPAQ